MRIRRLKLSAPTITSATCLLVLGGLLTIRYITPVRSEVNVSLYERRLRGLAERKSPPPATLVELVGDHPVYYRAERLRELSDVALCLSLYYWKLATGEGKEVPTGRVPATVEAIIAGARGAGLLPPGVQTSPRLTGVLNSSQSTLYVRYRPRPFGLEVISVPRGLNKEGGLLLRTPAGADSLLPAHVEAEHRVRNLIHDVRPVLSPSVAMFITDERVRVTVPGAAFAPVEELLSYGWRPVSLTAPQSMPPEDVRRLREWMSDPK